jgi:hypothetical protein
VEEPEVHEPERGEADETGERQAQAARDRTATRGQDGEDDGEQQEQQQPGGAKGQVRRQNERMRRSTRSS